jgi:hypothetical protein
MKKLLFFCMAVCIGCIGLAQQRATLPDDRRDIAAKKDPFILEDRDAIPAYPGYKAAMSPVETLIGNSWYDRQTNATIQNRFYYYDDGTFGATWMHGYANPGFDDRGTGYVYFDGNQWSEPPLERIEGQRCGWPNYWPLGENGEMVITHIAGGVDDGLLFNRRPEKGTGAWEEILLQGPAGAEALSFPCCVTTGIDHNTIHLLSMTQMVQFGGTLYQGIDGAMVYSRSNDGGNTWDIQNEIFPQMTSDYFLQFGPDQFAFAPPRGNTLAFVVGGTFNEAFLMKSFDDGDTWEKTLIWEHPYPLWNGAVTDTFYCPDGSWDIKLDNNGMAHCVFGINRAHSDGAGTFWFPFIDGIGYWNETMPAFSGTLDALNPYGEAGSELIEDYNLIGWTQDVDGDGEITFVGSSIEDIGRYYIGLSSMVQLVTGESDQLYVIWSSVTETYDNGLQNFRHLWSRVSVDGGTTWGPFKDLTVGIVHIFDECVWPDAAIRSDPNTIYLTYQLDGEPGMAVAGDLDPYGVNYWNFMAVNKDEITGVNKQNETIDMLTVHQNYPNPFSERTTVRIDLSRSGPVSLEVMNMMGQIVYQSVPERKPAGSHTFTIAGDGMAKGIYFYTVKTGSYEVTKKMILE